MVSGELQKVSPALEHFEEFVQCAAGRKIAIFLDYDGTLTPIVSRPEDAVLSEETRRTVKKLAALTPLAIVSGRDLADVRNMVGIEEIVYAGSHGFDIAGPEGLDIHYQHRADFLPILDEAEAELRENPGAVPGVLIERKKFSVAIHYRLAAAEDLPAIEAAVDRIHAGHPELRKALGKKIFELQPRIDWHKGKAVLWLLEQLGLDKPGVLPVYVGDDVTDEDAFSTLRDRGLGIVVMETPRETEARYCLRNPGEVRSFLESVASVLEE